MPFNLADFSNAYIGGQQINLDLQERQQDLQLKKQQVEANRLQMQQQQAAAAQQQQYSQAMQQLFAKADAADKTTKDAADPENSNPAAKAAADNAQRFQQLAKLSFSFGRPDEGVKFQQEADKEADRVAKIQSVQDDKAAESLKTVAQSAGAALASDDLMATQKDMFETVKQKQGLAAALQIPTDKAGYKSWLEQRQLQAVSAKDQLEFKRKMADDAESKRRWQAEEDDKARQRQIEWSHLALQRQNQQMDPPTTKDIDGFVYQYDPKGSVKGERLDSDGRWVKMGITQGALAHRDKEVLFSTQVGEIASSLGRIAELNANLTEGTFSKMGDKHTYLGSLMAVGGNKATTAQQQDLAIAMKGMGQEAAVIATMGTGRGPTQSLKDEFNSMIAPQAGDTNFAIQFRYANLRDWTLVRLNSADTSFLKPAEKEKLEAAKKEFEKLPSTADVIAAARVKGSPIADKTLQQGLRSQKQLWDLIQQHDAEASAAGATKPAADGGHAIDSILDKYK
jgi:hypothetical protein